MKMKAFLKFVTALLCPVVLCCPANVSVAFAATPPDPLVAIHVSELTQALETMPATAPTPTGTGTSGYQWWYTSWHYFVAGESLKEALRSDGTPFVEVSDSDIAGGRLLKPDGSPRYPILISLASEAIDDSEVTPLRNFVSAGGFVFAGSSAFTRRPDGTSRNDFALATEMGVHAASSGLVNFYLNAHFTKRGSHRLTSHIPDGTLAWSAPRYSDQQAWIIFPTLITHSSHYAWNVVASGATTLADGDSGPLLTVKGYGQGQFIYHGTFQPLIGHGGYDPGMYAYVIYRRAIEWAFESFNLPVVKVSPWPYQYDAAMMVRHDFENNQTSIRAIESSAQFEKSVGAKGDYYFSTGTLRADMGGDPAVIASIRNAVSSYGATIGSHNGGLKNPANLSLLPTDYEYWHWGPDEALDTTPPGYASGKAYAFASILASFQDVEGWLAGLDNGRTGCGTLNNCPRTWASPFFNSVREDSHDILEQLGGTVTMGEQKISPFPHGTLSYSTRGKHFSAITLPVSDWYVGTDIAQSTEFGHTYASINSAVDFYYDLGALVNFYGHAPSNNGSIQQQYVTYAVSKPRMWRSNSVGISDWWRERAGIAIAPAYAVSGNTYTLSSSVTGATDPASAIEIAVPPNLNNPNVSMAVYLDDAPANPSTYRTTAYGIKVLVGTAVSNVRVQYTLPAANQAPVAVNDTYTTSVNTALQLAAPGVLGNDSDPEGAALATQLVNGPSHGTLSLNTNGSFVYIPLANYVGSDSFTYLANDGITTSNLATVTITITSPAGVLLSDDFTRVSGASDPLSPWIGVAGTWTVTNGVLQGSGLPSAYASLYTSSTPLWTDYSVEGLVQFPAGAFGGGIGGRVNPATGSRYGAWIYPGGSVGGSNVLKLVKFRDWVNWSGTSMQQVSLPVVGTGQHTLKMIFNGSRVQVFYDGTLMIDVTDSNFDSSAPYASGGVSADMWTYTTQYVMTLDNVVVSPLAVNQAPVAVNDAYSTNAGTVLTVSAPGVLANDTNPAGGSLTAQMVSGPSYGTLTLNKDGSFVYTPVAGYAGNDSFTYLANNGTSNSNTGTVTLTVLPAAVSLGTLSLNPSSVTGGNSSQGTVTLSGPAPAGGAVVTLSDNSSSATVPSSVTVAAGSSSATFSITTAAVTSTTTVTVSAVYGGVTKTATLTLNPVAASLSSLSLNPYSVTGGNSSQGTVTLSGPAPAGGAVVTLSDNSSSATVPSSVTVAAGSSSATFSITTAAVTSTTTVTVSAVYGGVTKTATLTLNPVAASLGTLSLNPSSVTGGNSSQGTVTLSGPAPAGGAVVTLSDNSSSVTVPSSVTVAAGSSSATFTIKTAAVTRSTSATISAVYGGVTRRATLGITR